jgi:hypothetical protein
LLPHVKENAPPTNDTHKYTNMADDKTRTKTISIDARYKDWDLRFTRSGLFPSYYFVANPGNIPVLERWEMTSHRERDDLNFAFMNNQALFHTTYTPVEDRFCGIVQDLALIERDYPVYHSYIINTIMNGVGRDKYQDQMGRDGPWYKILAYITWNRASEQSKYYLPRVVISPDGEDADNYHKTQYPSWDWEAVTDKVVHDVLAHHYMEWYYDYCQPMLEKREGRNGSFFMAMQITIDYTSHLVNEKMKLLLDLYNNNPMDNNSTIKAFDALSAHRDSESERMHKRFKGNVWNLQRYDPLHDDEIPLIYS